MPSSVGEDSVEVIVQLLEKIGTNKIESLHLLFWARCAGGNGYCVSTNDARETWVGQLPKGRPACADLHQVDHCRPPHGATDKRRLDEIMGRA